jgi:uncharacterized protein
MEPADRDEFERFERMVGLLAREPARLGGPGDAPVRSFETHISRVLVVGGHAFKFKKPLRLPFLDQSTLEARRAACEAEIEVNRRLSPGLYLGVVAVTGQHDDPRIGTGSPVIDYAVRMRAFDPEQQLDRLASRGELEARHVEEAARLVAGLQAQAPVAPSAGAFGSSEQLHRETMENFDALDALPAARPHLEALGALRRWSARTLVTLGPEFRLRRRQGFVREGHGDLHLGNMALVDGRVTVFDAVEFDERLRRIDVVSEIAFLLMDLRRRGLAGLGNRFLNVWLEETGDYPGLRVLRHYLTYRALVRAKVAALRRGQLADEDPLAAGEEMTIEAQIRLAQRLHEGRRRGPLVITCGVSGAGKSWLCERLAQSMDAVRVRSDVERQRLAGPGKARYTEAATGRTYDRLAAYAADILGAGFPALVDATCLTRRQRERFLEVAARLDVPLRILQLEASPQRLAQRVRDRLARGDDASEATVEVLEAQIRSREPLAPREEPLAVPVDMDSDPDIEAIARRLRASEHPPATRRLLDDR